MKYFILIVIFVSITLMYIPTLEDAWGCSCGIASNIEYYNYADIVFVGTVVNKELSTSIFDMYISDTYIPENFITNIITFDVHSKWKGDLNDSISVETNNQESSCGSNFQKNNTYLVFAHDKVDDYPQTGLCSGNQIIFVDFEANFIEEIAFWNLYNVFNSIWFLVVLISIIIITSIVVIRRLKTKKHRQV